MKKLFLFLTAFVFFVHAFAKAQDLTLTLDEAVFISLRDNRDVLLKEEDVKKAKIKIAEAKAALLPEVNFTSNWADTRGYYLKDVSQFSNQASLRQYLYKGGKTVNTIEEDKYKFAVAQAVLDKTKSELVLNIKTAFYSFVLANDFADLNKAIVENIKGHLEFIEARYKSGQSSESDVLKIQASLDSAKEVYEASLNQIDSSQILLNSLLYLDKDVKIKAAAKLDYEPVEIAYDKAFLKAMQDRPEIRLYEAQENADKKAIEAAKSGSRPNIYASWDYYSRSTSSLTFSPSKGWQDYNVVGVTFSWPVFDGWATKAKVEQAISGLKQTQLARQKVIKDIALEMANAWIVLKNSIAGIASVESDIRVYNDNLLSVKDKYAQGIASSLDNSDANLKYNIALFNKKQAVYDYITAKNSFDKATGGM